MQTTLLQIVVLLFQSRVAPRILTPNISLLLTFGDSGLEVSVLDKD